MRTRLLLILCTLSGVAAAAPSFSSGVNQGNIDTPLITEASGLAGSRVNPGVLWTHNDSGGLPRVFALDLTGHLLGTWNLPGVNANDYEDIAVGPGPEAGVSYLYVGDIGDNGVVKAGTIG